MSAAAIASSAAEAARAGAGDLARLAALHRACLPDSILSALGGAGVRRYYAFALASPHEHVLVVREGAPGGEQAVAGCVLSTAAGTMLVRFARHAPAALAHELAGALARSGRLRRRIGARLVEAVGSRSTPSAPALPEVTQIFTDPALRGRGLGAVLLRGAEAALRQAGHRAYCIHTLRDDNDAGIRFYRREGFSAIGTTRSFGDPYLVMTKELT